MHTHDKEAKKEKETEQEEKETEKEDDVKTIESEQQPHTIFKLGLFLFIPIAISSAVYWYSCLTIYRSAYTFDNYKEACQSGMITRLHRLHSFVTDHIETVDGELSREEFLNYVWKGKPVLMKGAAKSWKVYKEWTDEALIERLSDVKFYVDLQKHHSTGESIRRRMELGTFIQNYKKRDWYLDSMSANSRLLDQLELPPYMNMSGMFEQSNDTTDFQLNFYLSSGNTNSPLHYDGYDNLLTVLDGRKEWIIGEISENEKLQYTGTEVVALLNVTHLNFSNHRPLCDIKWSRAIVEKGDTLYIPTLWPHHVYSPTSRNMAIGMWFNLPAYRDMLDEVDFSDETDTKKVVELMRNHVETRPHPCQVADCSPLPPGTLRSVLPDDLDESYSRESDVPPKPWFVLNNGYVVRSIAFGTGTKDGSIANVYQNTLHALNMGYRFIDTARIYGNEYEVGRAVRDCKWLREFVTVLTKIILQDLIGVKSVYQAVIKSVERSRNDLNLEYIDIVLIHDTDDNEHHHLLEAWRALETLVGENKIKTLGLSNTDVASLSYIRENARVGVSVVQNLFTPLLYDKEVYSICKDNDIVFMAYGISGDYLKVTESFKENPVTNHWLIRMLADKYHTSTHGILYNWASQKGVVIITRSTNMTRAQENLSYGDIMLSGHHLSQIDEMFVRSQL